MLGVSCLRGNVAGAILSIAAAVAIACSAASAQQKASEFTPLDLSPLFNQPHTNAFPEARDGFKGWFVSDDVSAEIGAERFVPTPWKDEYSDDRTPEGFGDWARATLFGPQGHTLRTSRRLKFRVRTKGRNVVAFDRFTVPMEKTLTGIKNKATHLHLLACGGWWPRGTMGLRLTHTDGSTDRLSFQTHEWVGGGKAAFSFDHGNLYHHCVELPHPDKDISAVTFIDTQPGPQLVIAAATLELRRGSSAEPEVDAEGQWRRLAASVTSFDEAVIVRSPDAAPLVGFAAQELQRCLHRLSGRLLTVSDEPAEGKAAIRLAVNTQLNGEALRIRTAAAPPALILEGACDRAVMYAAYALLEEFGVGFFLGGDTFPCRRAPLLVPRDFKLEAEPAFKVRGSLPWYNFLNSPTTWNYEDYKYFFDQMAKQRFNFVGFHSYDSEPFAAFEFDGKLIAGQPLVGSDGYGWGTITRMKTGQFGFGTHRYFDAENFAAEATLGQGGREDRIRACQALLRKSLGYAKSRGIMTCVGFEVRGDPTDPAEQKRFLARLSQLLQTYPMLDYVWLWQPESLGTHGWDVPAGGSPLAQLAREHFATFSYLGSRRRIVEAARLTAYVRLADAFMRRAAPEVRLIVAGWGGDRWMRFTDFFPGFDKALPEGVVLAALDNIDPTAQNGVSDRYRQVTKHEFWPIPWFESDGGGSRRDQWGPQCNVYPFVRICRDALEKRSAGLLGIHWRTRGIEEVVAYASRFAWQPGLSYEQFYDRFARCCFGGQAAGSMSAALQELEALGPRWTGGAGQVECGRFAWFSSPSLPSDRNLKRLAEIKSDITAIKIEAVKCGRSAGVERLDHILNTIDFLASYDRAALLYRSGGPVEKALAAGRTDEALRALHESHLPEAMHAYARKISTRSELGVLATMNVKAYAAYRKLLERAGGDKDAAWEAKPGPPLLIIPVHNTTYDVGEPAVVKAIAMDDKGIQGVRVHCRRLGQTAFTRVEMENYFRDSYRAALPGMTDGPGAFEFYVEAVDDYGGRTVSPHGAPEALYSAVVRPARAGAGSTRQLSPDLVDAILQPAELSRLFESASAGGPAPELARVDDVTAKTEPGGIRLQWRAVEGAAGYHVYRTARGENRPSNLTAAFPVAETAFLDADVEVGAAYSYVVRAVGHGLVEGPPSVAVSCTAAYHPPAGVKLAVGDKPLLDVRCAIRGPAGRIDDFNSFDRDKVVLRRQPISVRKLKGFGYCWQAGDCGCWAGGDSVSFRLEGLTAQGHYVLWLRCLSWDGYERTVSVSVSGDEAVREWKLPAGRDAQAGWRPIGFSAGGEQAVVVVRRLSGINAVVSQIVLVETRM